MLNEKLAQQLTATILEQKMSLEHLLGFLKNYPDITEFLNHNYFKISMFFHDSPLGQHVVAVENQEGYEINSNFIKKNQEPVTLEIPCVHYLCLQFKDHVDILSQYFNVEAFKMSYLNKGNKRYTLLGFNLYNLLNLKISDKNEGKLPITTSNIEEFFNFYYEKKNNNNYLSIYCDSLFPLFDFKLNIEDLLYENDKFTMEGRNVTIFLLNIKIQCIFKNLNELTHHERIPLDNLLQYKVKQQEIDFDFSVNSFFDLLVMKNYFLKSGNTQFCLTLLEKNPQLFTPEIMALLCLKNFELHELLIKNFPQNYLKNNSQDNFTHKTSNIMFNYSTLISEIQSIVETLASSDQTVSNAWNKLKLHIETIVQDNGKEFLSQNIEDRITFENIITKYIPSILNNYLSIPAHLRCKDSSVFIDMTLTQFDNIEKELEKIELAIMQEDIKKMKVFGKFLDHRLGNNTPDIIKLN